MRWSFKIAQVAGTEIRIHFTFLLFLAWIGLSYYRVGGAEAAAAGLTFLLGIFACVLLHEFGHVFAARAFGVPTPDVTLLPIGGVARLQRMPDHPWQELIVAVAGPAVNVVIAAVLLLFVSPYSRFESAEELNNPGTALLIKLASVNILLVLFNLVPAFPMDGGRVFRALLAMAVPYAKATQIAATTGQIIAVIFALVGLFGNPMLILIAFFIFLGAQQEAWAAQMKEIGRGLPVSEAMVTHLLKLPPHASLDDAVEALMRTSQHEFPIVEDDRPLGVLTRDCMIAALKRQERNVSVRELMRSDLPTVFADAAFEDAFREMQKCECSALPVVDSGGRFVGLITLENVGELMLVRSLYSAGNRPSWKPRALATT